MKLTEFLELEQQMEAVAIQPDENKFIWFQSPENGLAPLILPRQVLDNLLADPNWTAAKS